MTMDNKKEEKKRNMHVETIQKTTQKNTFRKRALMLKMKKRTAFVES